MGLLFLILVNFWPSCPAEGWITSEYGYRRHPITHRRKFHRGIDVANVAGTEIRSPWDAHVARVSRTRGMGLHVVLTSGPFRITMAHMRAVDVRRGDAVPRGGLVGRMGSSGAATGPHLHVELRARSRLLDPSVLLWSCVEPE